MWFQMAGRNEANIVELQAGSTLVQAFVFMPGRTRLRCRIFRGAFLLGGRQARTLRVLTPSSASPAAPVG